MIPIMQSKLSHCTRRERSRAGAARSRSAAMTHAPEGASSRPSISVLMSTYAKEKASNLEAALESLWTQTELPDEVVLVLDGPVGAEQEEVVARFAARGGLPELVVVSLEANQGLAKALNAGLERCRGTYVARMDSDDLCQPDRLAVQVGYAQRHPDMDVICSWSDEFFDDGTKSRLKVRSRTWCAPSALPVARPSTSASARRAT